MKRKALTRGLTLLLALTMLLAFAFSASAFSPGKGWDYGWGHGHGHWHHHCKPPYKPVNDTGYLIVRVLVAEDADLKTAFNFNYTINDGAKASFVLAPALTAAKATTFKMTYKVGTKFDVSQLGAAGFVTTSTGATGTIKPGDNVVEFVNARPAAPVDVPAMG